MFFSRRHWLTTVCLAAALPCMALPSGLQDNLAPAPGKSAYLADPAFQQAADDARNDNLPPLEQLSLWQKANTIAGEQCIECFRGIIRIQFLLRDWKAAEMSSVQMDAVAIARPDKVYAEASAAKALTHFNNGAPTREQLGQAEIYMRSAIALQPIQSLIFIEGQILATLGRDTEAKAAFQRYLAAAGGPDVQRKRAESFVEDPHLAANSLSPAAVAKAATPETRAAATTPAAGIAESRTPAKDPAATTPPPAYEADPKFQKALEEAKARTQTQDDRLEHWKRANKIAKNLCAPCLRQIIALQIQKQQWKEVVNSSYQLEQASSRDVDRYVASAERGMALLQANFGEPNTEQVTKAEASLHTALTINHDKNPPKMILFSEGRALALLGRDAEAKAIFQRYADTVNVSDSYHTRAEHFAENPRLAKLPMAPPFRLTTSEGEEISLDDMGGKVVLLDFWATWCVPCKETLPEVRRIAKEFAGQPLVVVSISGDADDVAWKKFVATNEMSWPQYRDANGALRNAYGVTSIPRFFTIDADGAVQSVKVGSNADIRGDIKRLVKRAHEAELKLASATARPALQ